MKENVSAKIMQITSMLIFGTIGLFVRAIPETEENYFNEIGNGINFVFGLRYTSNAKDTIHIELINSYNEEFKINLFTAYLNIQYLRPLFCR
mgnify:CR=1 FL=1